MSSQCGDCYECGLWSSELSPRSRCVHCEAKNAKFNRSENDDLRDRVAKLEAKIDNLEGRW